MEVLFCLFVQVFGYRMEEDWILPPCNSIGNSPRAGRCKNSLKFYPQTSRISLNMFGSERIYLSIQLSSYRQTGNVILSLLYLIKTTYFIYYFGSIRTHTELYGSPLTTKNLVNLNIGCRPLHVHGAAEEKLVSAWHFVLESIKLHVRAKLVI